MQALWALSGSSSTPVSTVCASVGSRLGWSRPPNGGFLGFFSGIFGPARPGGGGGSALDRGCGGGLQQPGMAHGAHSQPTTASIGSIGAIVDQLCARPAVAARQAAGVGFQPPSARVLVEVVEGLRSALFPGYFGLVQMTEGLRFHVGSILEEKLRHLQEQIVRGLVFAQCSQWQGAESPEQLRRKNEERAAAATRQLLRRLPELARLVVLDVEAAYTGDPAAISHDEVIFSYPGVRTIVTAGAARLGRVGMEVLSPNATMRTASYAIHTRRLTLAQATPRKLSLNGIIAQIERRVSPTGRRRSICTVGARRLGWYYWHAHVLFTPAEVEETRTLHGRYRLLSAVARTSVLFASTTRFIRRKTAPLGCEAAIADVLV